ncbi:hypothetical protein CPB86DRAFT_874259 [Serendipita vermifera]|nr:hypothetical protein CPB86DRAFT_874259 [Serendipita vermifera]
MSLKIDHHVNPHFHHPDLRPVHSLNQNSDDEAEDGPVQIEKNADQDAKRKFDEYFADYFLAPEADRPSKRHHKESDIPPEPKSESKTTMFRLFSTQVNPLEVSLQKAPSTLRSWSHSIQDSTKERHERRLRAKEATIEIEPYPFESHHTQNKPQELDHFATTFSERPKIAILTWKDGSKPQKEFKSKVPVIPAQKQDHSQGTSKPKKRKRFKTKPERPKAKFWRPSTSMGPKASGYALGYEGSWMVDDPSKVGYVRDKGKVGRIAGMQAPRRKRR